MRRTHFFYPKTKSNKKETFQFFRGFSIHTYEATEAYCHQYHSVLVHFFLYSFYFFLHHSFIAEMEARLQSSSSTSGIIIFIYMKPLKHYVPHVPHWKVWFKAQFIGPIEGSQCASVVRFF